MFKHGLGFYAWDLPVQDYSQCLKIVKTLICLPVKAFWDPEVRQSSPDVKCLNQGIVFVTDSCFAVVTDATILIIPIVLVWSMSLPFCKKVKAVLLLGAGGVAVAVTGYRVPLLFKYEHSKDVTSNFVVINLLCSLEQSIGFTCACLPFFNLFRSARRRSPRQTRLLANVPRTSHRGKPAGGDGLPEDQSSFSVSQYMGMQLIMMTNKHPVAAYSGSGGDGVSRDAYDATWQLEVMSSSDRRRDRWPTVSGGPNDATGKPPQDQKRRGSASRGLRIADEEETRGIY
ncbi:hypothetical protein PG999_007925 [Apiospora kogelbergensis]|uniref:Rhodopsin domain-containing protein n=1 Tax=Apiospora kogelbergensis TaxID=1337665 RepID=A0AAW0QUI8_9PEZI